MPVICITCMPCLGAHQPCCIALFVQSLSREAISLFPCRQSSPSSAIATGFLDCAYGGLCYCHVSLNRRLSKRWRLGTRRYDSVGHCATATIVFHPRNDVAESFAERPLELVQHAQRQNGRPPPPACLHGKHMLQQPNAAACRPNSYGFWYICARSQALGSTLQH